MRVVMTGACGQIAPAILKLSHDWVLYDQQMCPERLPENAPFIQGDLGDSDALLEIVRDADAVLHLAAASHASRPWDEVVRSNINGLYHLLEAARRVQLERIIFASTNHVVGHYERDHAPTLYQPGHDLLIDHHAPIQADSYYGVSKAMGEHLGRYYAETGGPRFYALRIGATVAEDHPYAYAERGVQNGEWPRDSDAYAEQVARLKAIWLSQRDLVQLVECLLRYDGPPFDVFYGVSGNAARWLDIEHAQRQLGYEPQDNGNIWTAPPAKPLTPYTGPHTR